MKIIGLFSKTTRQDKINIQFLKEEKIASLFLQTGQGRGMKYHCDQDKPSAYDPEKYKFLQKSCCNFLDSFCYF